MSVAPVKWPSFPCLFTVLSLCVCEHIFLCVQVSLWYEGTRYVGLGTTLRPHFNFITSVKMLFPNKAIFWGIRDEAGTFCGVTCQPLTPYVLVCISLMANNAKYLVICVISHVHIFFGNTAVYIFGLLSNWIIFCPFEIWHFFILETSSLFYTWFANIFFPVCTLSFYVLYRVGLFRAKKKKKKKTFKKIWRKFNLPLFPFIHFAFIVKSNNNLPSSRLKRFLIFF